MINVIDDETFYEFEERLSLSGFNILKRRFLLNYKRDNGFQLARLKPLEISDLLYVFRILF